MICPDCGHEFPLTFKRYNSSKRRIYQCPQCSCYCQLEHLTKKMEVFHALIIFFLIIGIVTLTDLFFEDVIKVDLSGKLIGLFLAIIMVSIIDIFYEKKYTNIKKINSELALLMTKSVPITKKVVGIYILLMMSVFFGTIIFLAINDSLENPQIIADFNKKLTLELAPFEKEILDDLKLLTEHPPFKTFLKTKDASVILNEKISWSDHAQPYSLELKKLYKKHRKWWKSKNILFKIKDDPDLDLFDTSWMNDLASFDHWKLETYPPYRAILKQVYTLSGEEKAKSFEELPHPLYYDLSTLARIHFLQLYKKGSGLQSLKNIRKFAELSHSTGTLWGHFHALNLLSEEDYLVKTFKIKNWTIIPQNIRDAYRRIPFISQQLFYSALFQDFPAQYAPYINPQTGMCPGGLEMITSLIKYQDSLKPRFLFEEDYSDILSKNLQLQKNLLKKCDKEEYGSFLTDTPSDANPWILEVEDGQETERHLNMSKIPYLRRNFVIHFLPYSYRPYYLKEYRRNKNNSVQN